MKKLLQICGKIIFLIYLIKHESLVFRKNDVAAGLKATKCGKACGVDGLTAEHFIHADESILSILSILFNSFFIHVFFPESFMKSTIAPIVKNKTGDSSDTNNYRPIALVTAMSKILYYVYS